MKTHKQERCKRCGQSIDRKDYAEHLVKFHNDFSEMKNGKPCLLPN